MERAPKIDPEVIVQSAAVEHFEDHLHVGGTEEPEISGVGGEGHGVANTGVALEVAPFGFHLEASAIEAEAGGRGLAAAGAQRQGPKLAAGEVVVGDEVKGSTGGGEELGIGGGGPGRYVLEQPGAGFGAVALPGLEAVIGVEGREEEPAAGGREPGGLGAERSWVGVAHQGGARGGAVARPQLTAVDAVVGREVEPVVEDGQAEGGGMERVFSGECEDWHRPSLGAVRSPEGTVPEGGEEIPEDEVEVAVKSREVGQAVRETEEAAAHTDGTVARTVRLPDPQVQRLTGDEEDVGTYPGEVRGHVEFQALREPAGPGQGAIAPPEVTIKILPAEEVHFRAEGGQEFWLAHVRGKIEFLSRPPRGCRRSATSPSGWLRSRRAEEKRPGLREP